ncbi:MAG TPA: deoxyribose-phosphate aldolase [Lentisphaeria bacterium]|nr:MAG: deoxyribose-phosphate aldolase [Lentisphaerae bacterium GWF2_38_69]HBM15589.1 deoxyribose-phosphate aldolase [Lentisphaeria bacterium]
MSKINPKDLAKYIDHTALKAATPVEEIQKLCKEAAQYKFASVCINPYYVPYCKKALAGSGVKVCTVIGFPLGATTKEAKAAEAAKAVADGADEVDMVLNVSAMKSKEYKYVEDDIKAVVEAVPKGTCVKVILETCYLTKDEIKLASELSMKAKATFVKTSTGFGTGGALVEDVKIMKAVVGDKLEVKASGAVRDYETAVAMIEAGATRLGTSSGLAIISGTKSNSAY